MKEIQQDEIWAGIYGKGILIFIIIALPLYAIVGYDGREIFSLQYITSWLILSTIVFYTWRFKLVLDFNGKKIINNDKLKELNDIILYSILNVLIASIANASLVFYLAIYQGILINGYLTKNIYVESNEYWNKMIDLKERKMKKEKEDLKIEKIV